MKLYVIRHGQSEANKKVAHAGWNQVPLTQQGEQEAQEAKKLIEGLHFDKVIVSDLRRAQQTAQIMLPSYEKQTDIRLREINMGDLDGWLVKDCIAKFGDAYIQNRKARNFADYGGEDLSMIRSRVSAFMEDMTREPEDNVVAAVCHEGTLYCMLYHVLDIQNADQQLAFADNCSISEFVYKDGRWFLQKWNETGRV